MKQLLKISLILFSLVVVSIASSNPKKSDYILIGKSTQDSIKIQFGEPDNKSIRGDKETWFYNNLNFKGRKNISIAIEFDSFMFVEDYTIVK